MIWNIFSLFIASKFGKVAFYFITPPLVHVRFKIIDESFIFSYMHIYI